MTSATTPTTPLDLPARDAGSWLADRTGAALDRARATVADLKAGPGRGTEEVLREWNDLEIAFDDVAAAHLYAEVHPDEAVRATAEQAVQDAERLQTELSLDAELYAVVADRAGEGLDEQAARFLARLQRDFRRSGVDRDEETRTRIAALRERLVLLGQDFSKNIRLGVRTVRLRPEQLAGMPADWLEAHPAGDDGLVPVTTDYPDQVPVRTYCADAGARREVTVAAQTVAWPDNDTVLKEILATRAELAGLLGHPDWASYDAEVKMIKEGPAIPAFIDRITEAAAEPGRRDLEALLARKRVDDPEATGVDAADATYYAELVRREQHDVDAQLVRTYFDFAKVREGLLAVTGRLFGLTYVPVAGAASWHEDVTAYDVLDETGARLGRIHLDLHPREGKYKHAAQFPLVSGVDGRRLAEGVLVCNFPRGLMEHDDVVTLFHEFGHLVHHVLAGRQRWARFSGVATEWDFVEAPSQMLEEWAWDPAVLRTFATDADGEPIPVELVERMRAADDFGKGTQARNQMFYAALSYHLHVERPEDLTARTRELQAAYSLFPYIEGTHMTCSFGHLDGYSSGYYTYMWSLVIAKDLFSAFDREDLFAPDVARRYRDLVLAPGGSKDAADLVADFLGRPYTFDAYAAWLAS